MEGYRSTVSILRIVRHRVDIQLGCCNRLFLFCERLTQLVKTAGIEDMVGHIEGSQSLLPKINSRCRAS